jgi:hypothetical protein
MSSRGRGTADSWPRFPHPGLRCRCPRGTAGRPGPNCWPLRRGCRCRGGTGSPAPARTPDRGGREPQRGTCYEPRTAPRHRTAQSRRGPSGPPQDRTGQRGCQGPPPDTHKQKHTHTQALHALVTPTLGCDTAGRTATVTATATAMPTAMATTTVSPVVRPSIPRAVLPRGALGSSGAGPYRAVGEVARASHQGLAGPRGAIHRVVATGGRHRGTKACIPSKLQWEAVGSHE